MFCFSELILNMMSLIRVLELANQMNFESPKMKITLRIFTSLLLTDIFWSLPEETDDLKASGFFDNINALQWVFRKWKQRNLIEQLLIFIKNFHWI